MVSVKNLVHRPGSMETLDEVVQAPAEMGNALIGVQEGTDMDLNIRLESVVDGILVSGTTVVDVHGECSLCLDPIDYEMSAHDQGCFSWVLRVFYVNFDASNVIVCRPNLD